MAAETQAAALDAVRRARRHSEAELRKIERQIFELEGGYLAAFPRFNVLQGFEKGAVVGSRGAPADASARAFSASSLTSPLYVKGRR